MKQQIILILLFCLSIQSYGQSNEEPLPTYFAGGSLSVRTNVITWMTLTPNLGIEYKTSDHIGLVLDGGWTHWRLANTRYYRMWNIAPQARYYFGDTKYNYLGLQYSMGEYNFTGNQGRYLGGGLTLGHQFYVYKNLMVDLGLSLGYLHLYDKERYKHISGKNYLEQKESSSNYWGPIGASITFVWNINH